MEYAHKRSASVSVRQPAAEPAPVSRVAGMFPKYRSNSLDALNFSASIEQSPRLVAQRAVNVAIQSSPRMEIQRQQLRTGSDPSPRSNPTGLPDALKTGIESLSGMSLDPVKVHYNSTKPTQLNALAYTQGYDIHVATGQERHLPHEAWHVVQQAQGRVQPTMQMKNGVPLNDDSRLEHEADVMGERAKAGVLQRMETSEPTGSRIYNTATNVIQCAWIHPPKSDGEVEQWDKLIDGVRWYRRDGLLWYEIVDLRKVPPGSLETFKLMEGEVHARSRKDWEILTAEVDSVEADDLDKFDPYQQSIAQEAQERRRLELQRHAEQEGGRRLAMSPSNQDHAIWLNEQIEKLYMTYKQSDDLPGKVFGEKEGQNTGSVGQGDKAIEAVLAGGNFRERMTLVYNAYTNKRLAHFFAKHFGVDPYTYFDRPHELERDRRERRDNPGRKTTDLSAEGEFYPPLSEREKAASVDKRKGLKWQPGSKMFYFDPLSDYEAETRGELTSAGRSSSAWTMHKIADDLHRFAHKGRPGTKRLHRQVFRANLAWMLPAEDHTLYEIAEAARHWRVKPKAVWDKAFQGQLPFRYPESNDERWQAQWLFLAQQAHDPRGKSAFEIHQRISELHKRGVSEKLLGNFLSSLSRGNPSAQKEIGRGGPLPEISSPYFHPLWDERETVAGQHGIFETPNSLTIERVELDKQVVRERRQQPFLKKGVFGSLRQAERIFDQFCTELLMSDEGVGFYREVLRPRLLVMTTEAYQQLADLMFWRLRLGPVPDRPIKRLRYFRQMLANVKSSYDTRVRAAMKLKMADIMGAGDLPEGELIGSEPDWIEARFDVLARKEGDPVNTRIKRPIWMQGKGKPIEMSPFNDFTLREFQRAQLPTQRGVVEESAYLMRKPEQPGSQKALVMSNRGETPLSYGFGGAIRFAGDAQVGLAYDSDSYRYSKDQAEATVKKRGHEVYGTLFRKSLLEELRLGAVSKQVTNRLEDFRRERAKEPTKLKEEPSKQKEEPDRLKTLFPMKSESATTEGQVNLNKSWVFEWLGHNRLLNHFEIMRLLSVGVVKLDGDDRLVAEAILFPPPGRQPFEPWPVVGAETTSRDFAMRLRELMSGVKVESINKESMIREALARGYIGLEDLWVLKRVSRRLYNEVVKHYQFF